MTDLPPPFAGWLEEHPDGGFVITHEGGTSGTLRTYEAVSDYLDSVDVDTFTVVRIRHVHTTPGLPAVVPKLYPPPD